MFSAEPGQMSAVETGQMSAAETGQMPAVETRQMSTTETGLPPTPILPATVGGNFAKLLQEPSSKRTRPYCGRQESHLPLLPLHLGPYQTTRMLVLGPERSDGSADLGLGI